MTTTTYRDFLEEVALTQLRDGRNGLRLVGESKTPPGGARRLGLLVPHPLWKNSDEWETVFSGEHRLGLALNLIGKVSTKR